VQLQGFWKGHQHNTLQIIFRFCQGHFKFFKRQPKVMGAHLLRQTVTNKYNQTTFLNKVLSERLNISLFNLNAADIYIQSAKTCFGTQEVTIISFGVGTSYLSPELSTGQNFFIPLLKAAENCAQDGAERLRTVRSILFPGHYWLPVSQTSLRVIGESQIRIQYFND